MGGNVADCGLWDQAKGCSRAFHCAICERGGGGVTCFNITSQHAGPAQMMLL